MVCRAGTLLLAAVIGACRATAVGQAPNQLPVTPLFGPVVGAEVIGGRVQDGPDDLLLAGGTQLVRVDVARRRFDRRRLAIRPAESCWSLARLAGGQLWTLRDRRTLARVEPDGRVLDEVPLASPHFGVFAAGDRLIYQEANFTPPAAALLVGAPDGTRRTPWSRITTRTFPTLARASVGALNMVSCGQTQTAERACWFPDEAAVSLVDASGNTRRVALAGLDVVSPEALLTADNPRRPVRDAYVDADGRLWVLSTGVPAPGAGDSPGGWILARYSAAGTPEGRSRLQESARLILRVDAVHVTLLFGSGMVGEVARW